MHPDHVVTPCIHTYRLRIMSVFPPYPHCVGFPRWEAETLRLRRCRACVAVSLRVKALPVSSASARARIMKLPPLDANGEA